MHRSSRLSLALFLFVAGCYASRPHEEARHRREPAVTAISVSINEVEEAIFVATNRYRRENDRPPLEIDRELSRFARSRSADMANRHYFEHTEPGGKSVFDQMRLAGISYSFAAENIHFSEGVRLDKAAESAMQGWIHSPGHRANMLSRSPSHIGIGVAVGDHNRIYSTQDFSKPDHH